MPTDNCNYCSPKVVPCIGQFRIEWTEEEHGPQFIFQRACGLHSNGLAMAAKTAMAAYIDVAHNQKSWTKISYWSFADKNVLFLSDAALALETALELGALWEHVALEPCRRPMEIP